jgi:hypothetical protein
VINGSVCREIFKAVRVISCSHGDILYLLNIPQSHVFAGFQMVCGWNDIVHSLISLPQSFIPHLLLTSGKDFGSVVAANC